MIDKLLNKRYSRSIKIQQIENVETGWSVLESNNKLVIQKNLAPSSRSALEIIKITSLILIPLLILVIGLTGNLVGLFFYLIFLSPFIFIYFYDKDRILEWEMNKNSKTIIYRTISPNYKILKVINLLQVESILNLEPYEPKLGNYKTLILIDNKKRFPIFIGRKKSTCKRLGLKIAKFLEKPLYTETSFRYMFILSSIPISTFLVISIVSFIFGYYIGGLIFLFFFIISVMIFIHFLWTDYKSGNI